MTKRTQELVEILPSLTKEQGRRAFVVMKEKGERLFAERPIQEAAFDTWSKGTVDYIEQTFGSRIGRGHMINFVGQQQIQFGHPEEQYLERKRAKQLQNRIAVLASLIEQLDTEITLQSSSSPPIVSADDFIWHLLHAKIASSAKSRFETGQYADAVEAALKELNSVIKEMVKKKTGQEHDGSSLMQKAFSPNPPVLVALDDLSTESGKDIQQGYMQIFAGAMTGIRNPKAHANLNITKERAIHFLFLASLLFYKLDERP